MSVMDADQDEILNIVSASEFHSVMSSTGMIPYWTVESMLPDYPGIVVARLWTTHSHGIGGVVEQTAYTAVLIAPSIEQLRGLLPPGLLRVPRAQQDDCRVIERWMS